MDEPIRSVSSAPRQQVGNWKCIVGYQRKHNWLKDILVDVSHTHKHRHIFSRGLLSPSTRSCKDSTTVHKVTPLRHYNTCIVVYTTHITYPWTTRHAENVGRHFLFCQNQNQWQNNYSKVFHWSGSHSNWDIWPTSSIGSTTVILVYGHFVVTYET